MATPMRPLLAHAASFSRRACHWTSRIWGSVKRTRAEAIAATASAIAALLSLLVAYTNADLSFQSGLYSKEFDFVVDANDYLGTVIDFARRCPRLRESDTSCGEDGFDKLILSFPWHSMDVKATLFMSSSSKFFIVAHAIFIDLYNEDGTLNCKVAQKAAENIRRFNNEAASMLELQRIRGEHPLITIEEPVIDNCSNQPGFRFGPPRSESSFLQERALGPQSPPPSHNSASGAL